MKICKIGDICNVNPSSYSDNEGWSYAYYLDTSNITENVINTIQYFDLKKEKLPSRARRIVEMGDIIYSTVRPDQRHYGFITHTHRNFLVSTGFTTIRAKEDVCDSKYLYYFLTQEKIILYLQSLAEQAVSTFPSIRSKDIEELIIPLPPLPVQKKIAAILSSLDDKIEINTRMNKVLEETARALFHRWFVEFEFPNDEGKPYKSSGGRMIASEMGEIPEGWRVMSLDQIADFMNGLACQKYPPQNDEEGLPVLKIRELRSANLSDADRVSSTVPKKYYVTDGDVIFSWSGSLIVDIWCSGLVILNQHLFKVTSDTYPKWFYYSWIEYHLSEFQGIASDKATTMGHIQRKHLTNSKVVVPPSEVLEKMNLIMEPLLEQMIRDKCENLYLCKCRDSLLPKLMNNTIGLD